MTPAPISVERYTVTGDIAYPIHEDTNGEYVRHSDYAALLHQLAELQQAHDDLRDFSSKMTIKANQAERDREEACGLMREVYDTVALAKPITPQPVNLVDRIAAFLAANK